MYTNGGCVYVGRQRRDARFDSTGCSTKQSIAALRLAKHADMRGGDQIDLSGQGKQRCRRTGLSLQLKFAERCFAIRCNDFSEIQSDFDGGIAFGDVPTMPVDMNLKHRREGIASPCKQRRDIGVIENGNVACNRSLPFLARERAGRGTVAGLDGLNAFLSALADPQRQAAFG